MQKKCKKWDGNVKDTDLNIQQMTNKIAYFPKQYYIYQLYGDHSSSNGSSFIWGAKHK